MRGCRVAVEGGAAGSFSWGHGNGVKSCFVRKRAFHVLFCPFLSCFVLGPSGGCMVGVCAGRRSMAEKNKIDRYGLGPRVEELWRGGKTTVEIAEIVTAGFLASGIEDSVDQSTVSRWLKKIKTAEDEARAEYERQTREVIRAKVQDGVAGDIGQIESVQAYLFMIVENKEKGVSYDVRTRMAAGQALVKVIDTKLRLPGVMNEGDGDASSIPAGSAVHGLLRRLEAAVGGGAGFCGEGVVTQ